MTTTTLESATQTVQTPEQLKQLCERVVTHVDEFSKYAIARECNKVLANLQVEKRVREQMLYNYDKNGLIVQGVKNAKSYKRSEVIHWIAKYVFKNVISK